MYSMYKQKTKEIHQAEHRNHWTKSIDCKSLLFLKWIEIGYVLSQLINLLTMGSWIMHSSLRSSCIMFHEPSDNH